MRDDESAADKGVRGEDVVDKSEGSATEPVGSSSSFCGIGREGRRRRVRREKKENLT